jgi:hypothetical protein
MGWASMNEDNESRYFNATIIRNKVDRVMNNNATTSSSQRDKKSAGPTKLKTFAAPQARPLPVIILADVSGSMAENGKIDALNVAVEQMVASFAKESRLRAEIQVGLITFGGRDAMTHLPLVAAQSVNGITRFSASGGHTDGCCFRGGAKASRRQRSNLLTGIQARIGAGFGWRANGRLGGPAFSAKSQ